MAPKWDDTEEIKQPAASAPTWDDTEEVSGKSVGGFVSNAVSDAGGIIGGAASLAGNLITHPIDTTVSTVKGIPTMVKQLAKDWGVPEAMEGRFHDAIKKIGESVYEKPVSRALDVAAVAMPALKGMGVIKGVEGAELASKAGELGDLAADTSAIYRAKNLGARTKAFQELGEGEAIRIGNRAKKLEMTGGAKGTLAKGKGFLKETGAEINELRDTGNKMKAAPSMDEIDAAIDAELRNRYTKGLGAGENTEFNRAVDDVHKLNPKMSPTKQVPGVKQVTPGAGEMNLTDDSRLASQAAEGTKDVTSLEQMDFAPKQMDLIDPGMPELFPQGPTEGVAVPQVKQVNVGTQKGIPDLSGQQDLLPMDPTASKLIDTLNEVPNPDFKAPGTSDFARKATEMNDWAANEKSLLRPSGAASDVANVVSAQNDASLVHALGPDLGKTYVDDLSKHTDLKTMTHMLKEKRSRELGSSHAPGSMSSKVVHAVQDRFGYRVTAAALDKVASILRASPETFGKYAEVLNHAMTGGPAALATTVDLLSQNDPQFADQLRQMESSNGR